ncbi:MAG: hypothetical protein M1833_004243 [Piccolia ochrophora]|nr:MAG: hypothetical protein M1833_004243 [Piccolia ochrophora]
MDLIDAQKVGDKNALTCLCPFLEVNQLNSDLNEHLSNIAKHLPGHPRVPLQDKEGLLVFLESELCSRDLERLAPRLWWMSKHDSHSISPLHRQRVKKRNVIVSEDPKLHLVWIHDRIFIKPLPEYLLSHSFWKHHLAGGTVSNAARRMDSVRKAALGYLRTYFYLIRHESDFRIAQDPALCLVPAHITWKEFCDFSADFKYIQDYEVSGRYGYGEIRLTRLNFYAKLLLGKWYFQRTEWQYGAYFAQLYGPFLFFFALSSVMLSAMQVEVGIEQLEPLDSKAAFRQACRGFSIASVIVLVCVVVFLALLLIYKIAKEWQYALRDRFRRRRKNGQTATLAGSETGGEKLEA